MSDKIPDMPDDEELQEILNYIKTNGPGWLSDDSIETLAAAVRALQAQPKETHEFYSVAVEQITGLQRDNLLLNREIVALKEELKTEHEKRILLRKATRDFYDNPYSQAAGENLWKELEK